MTGVHEGPVHVLETKNFKARWLRCDGTNLVVFSDNPEPKSPPAPAKKGGWFSRSDKKKTAPDAKTLQKILLTSITRVESCSSEKYRKDFVLEVGYEQNNVLVFACTGEEGVEGWAGALERAGSEGSGGSSESSDEGSAGAAGDDFGGQAVQASDEVRIFQGENLRFEIFCGRGFLRGCSGSSKSKSKGENLSNCV